MTKKQATEWVYSHDDMSESRDCFGNEDNSEMIEAYTALAGRAPDADELQDLWSFLCSITDNGGNRPE